MILSHRGFWLKKEEQNTLIAFERSLANGFGIETDVRDYKGQLVISHDMPNENTLSVERFFKLYSSHETKNQILALNIKADGLQDELFRLIKFFGIEKYFVFDMSIPDTLQYLRRGMNTYTRQSEYEAQPSMYQKTFGVWMDEFIGPWIRKEIVTAHIDEGKSVAIVSPELHGREYEKQWGKYKKWVNLANDGDIHLCTDYPIKAKNFFNE